jgi:hypothetical protein
MTSLFRKPTLDSVVSSMYNAEIEHRNILCKKTREMRIHHRRHHMLPCKERQKLLLLKSEPNYQQTTPPQMTRKLISTQILLVSTTDHKLPDRRSPMNDDLGAARGCTGAALNHLMVRGRYKPVLCRLVGWRITGIRFGCRRIAFAGMPPCARGPFAGSHNRWNHSLL